MVRGQDSRKGDGWLLVTLVAMGLALFVYPLSLNIPLLDPDEGLHASIAQEMVEGGDWVTPRSLGQPFYDKPVLYFWAEALSLKLFGMNEIAVRLPGIFFGLLGVATTGLVAGRMFDRRTGMIAALTYATTILPTALVQAATHDVALVPWVNLAILLFWQSERAVGFRAQSAYAVGLGVVLGLAILTKGLVGVALVGVAYGGYLVIARRISRAACVRGTAALAIAAGIASCWYLAMEIRNPGYLYYYFVERHLLGYVTQSQRHGKAPAWFYLPILLGGGLPWIAYLPVVVRDWWDTRSARPDDNGALALVWCWLVGGTALLSVAQSKMVTYVWPVFPAVAILAAVAWARLLSGGLSGSARRWLAGTFYGLCLTGPVMLPAAMLVIENKYHLQFSSVTRGIGVAVALTSWIPVVFWRIGRAQRALTIGNLSLAAQFAFIMTVILPHVANVNTARDLAAYFNLRDRLPSRLVVVDERIGSVVFYLEPQLRRQIGQGQLESVGSGQIGNTLLLLEPGTVFAVAERRLRRLEPLVNLADAPYERAGQYRIYTAAELKDHRGKVAAPKTFEPATGAAAPPLKQPPARQATKP